MLSVQTSGGCLVNLPAEVEKRAPNATPQASSGTP